MGEPNAIAYLALLAWIPISALLFRLLRPQLAIIMVLLGAALFLPERVDWDLPAVPSFNKHSAASLLALLGCVYTSGARLCRSRPGRGLEILILLSLLGCLPTVLSNRDTLWIADSERPGMGYYDAVSMAVEDLLSFGIPFFLGRVFFQRARDMRLLILSVASFGLLYSVLALWEIRMSPNLHKTLYGFYQQPFHTVIRLGGYRPMVFMTHGLAVSLFLLASLLGSIALSRVKQRLPFGVPASLAAVYLVVVTVLSRALSAVIYGLLLVPVAVLLRPKTKMLIAAAVASIVLMYPLIRLADWVPVEPAVDFFSRIDPDRGHSLAGRMSHEYDLLERARDRVLFGWGHYGRNRIFDPETGEDLSRTDGFWILQLGRRGVVGFICVFGLLLFPIVLAYRRIGRIRSPASRELLSGLALIILLNGIDLILNAFLYPFLFLLSGALYRLPTAIELQERAAGFRPAPGGRGEFPVLKEKLS